MIKLAILFSTIFLLAACEDVPVGVYHEQPTVIEHRDYSEQPDGYNYDQQPHYQHYQHYHHEHYQQQSGISVRVGG